VNRTISLGRSGCHNEKVINAALLRIGRKFRVRLAALTRTGNISGEGSLQADFDAENHGLSGEDHQP